MQMICVTCGGEMRRVREYSGSSFTVTLGFTLLLSALFLGGFGVYGIATRQREVMQIVNEGHGGLWVVLVVVGLILGISALRKRWLLRCAGCGIEPRPVYQAFVER